MNIKTEIVDGKPRNKELHYPDLEDGSCFMFSNNKDSVYVKGTDLNGDTVRTNLCDGNVYHGSLEAPIIQVYPKNPFQFTLAKPGEASP